MRVLLLLDNGASPLARTDCDVLLAHLDRTRIQPIVASLRGSVGDIHLKGRFRFDPRLIFRLQRLIRREKIELVHVLEQAALPIAGRARAAGVPLIGTIYRYEGGTTPRSYLLSSLRYRVLLQGVDQITVPFENVRRALLLLYRHPHPITVISPGLLAPAKDEASSNREALGLPEGALIVMVLPPEFPTSQLLLDRAELALELLKYLIRKVPDVHLAVVGSGNFTSAMQRAAMNYRPGLPVVWCGERSEAEQWAILEQAAVYVDVASAGEVSPGLIRAALAGKPIVAPNIVSVHEVIETNVCGILVEAQNAAEFAAQIARLMQYEGLAGRLGRVAQKRAEERFSVAAQIQALTVFYEQTVYEGR
ncbi:MAG TPA: glycosyltransferase family 4 protein [Aggregatilineales bacterium]|nr:glycosyltransferase family 4 protein [Anaerolineales bacterium]HRE47723.1 glycosyltransferase family 4 protein [Aggregatilineales bacterium]